MNLLLYFFSFIKLTISINLYFPNTLQRFVYDDSTNTIILASINHIYSLNATNLSIISNINTYPLKTDHHCLLTNTTSLSKNVYYFSTSSYLISTLNNTFNQLLLLTNNSILICSTSNRGGSCQLRSLTDLKLLKNSSQRLVSSSPFYPSIGFINKNNSILYVSNTYDPQCDPFYEIPTISGRHLINEHFLSIINFKSGQSALQQSTNTLRLLNIRLIKDFFLSYLYGFEYKHFSYFLTIQQFDIHHKHKLQTKILRFCQTLQQPIIKSYVEIPLTCGKNYQYLITAKFSKEKNILYGLFRNTTLANLTSTSHAVCEYSMDLIQEGFFQTIKRCLVDGRGYRGLGFISSDTHCVANKNLNEINYDYCPEENDSFFQYPIGGHRAIEQNKPIIELNEKVNFTAIEIGSSENDLIILLGDDNGTVHTFQTSNIDRIGKQKFQSDIIIDLKLINKVPMLKNAKVLILTNNQIIKQNLSTCEQYTTCNECSNVALCHWCSKENRCTSTFECIHENKKNNRINMCTNIERVIPQTLSVHSLNSELEVIFNVPLQNNFDEYKCQFSLNDKEEPHYTNAVLLNDSTLKCLPALLNNKHTSVYNIILSIYHIKTNLTFGYYDLLFINCSSFLSCSSCTSYSNLCLWNPQTVNCSSQQDIKSSLSFDKHLIKKSNQCSVIYSQQPINHLAFNVDTILIIHIEQCNQSLDIDACQLNDHRKRFSFIASNPLFISSVNENNLCLVICSFQWRNFHNFHHISFHRPLNLDLSIHFSNETTAIVSHTHISLYHCERMAFNCTSCLQLDSSFNCIWCNNMCRFKNQTDRCSNNRECVSPIIQTIEPLILPLNGGTLVTIKGKNFDLFNLSIHLVDVPCQLIEGESSYDKIICQSGSAGSTLRTGHIRLKFGPHGPQIHSRQTVSYINPTISSIEPLIGVQSGGTLLTIHGHNLTLGNNHISILIGHHPCQHLSISDIKIECRTTSFSPLLLNKNQPIDFIFDRQTKITSKELFHIVPDPILYSFDKYHFYQSFISGGHQIVILGNNFNTIQKIQLEFQRFIFISPLFHNNTHLAFLTPSIRELNLSNQLEIEMKLYLDNFNKTSTVIYMNDPVIYQLEPMLQIYTNELIIPGANLTAIGHTKKDIIVHIGCDLCTVIHVQSDKILCQPPLYRPEKYSNTKRLCYDSEHPSIIVSIDNLHSHVGFMIYPKKVIILGIVSGCLFAILFIVLIILLLICIKIRYTQQKFYRQYFNANPQEIEKEKIPLIDSSSTSISVRSYLNYLQFCYYYHHLSYDIPKYTLNNEILNQFKYLIQTNDQFIECLLKILLKSNNKKLLNNLILTQRYNLNKLLKFHHHSIYFNICILTSYDAFLINHLHSVFSQLYYQLKLKISNAPIDAIEPTISYYSLNNTTILTDHSIQFQTIQLIIHIDLNNHTNSVFNLTCLTCDTISQVKQKILDQLNSFNRILINECKLYLITNNSYSSSSSTASSSVPLTRKSLLTQVCFNRTMKYSTKIIQESYLDYSNGLFLFNDIDNTNEEINNWKKLNTLQHYGIIRDGYEFKMIVPNRQINYDYNSIDKRRTLRSSYHYSSTCENEIIFSYLKSYPLSELKTFPFNETDQTHYIHLLNHTYEEIGSESSQLSLNNNYNKTYRLFETKSIIHSVLINLIEILFTNLLHSETYLTELIEQYSEFFHIFYAHFIPFIFQNFNCLFDISIDTCLNSSLDILARIFQIACCQQNEHQCSLCIELINNKNSNLNMQNCTLLFTDEIQRVRLHYTDLERCLNNKTLFSEYASTNTGIDRNFELDDSIFNHLIEYSYLHADEIVEDLENQRSDNDTLLTFLNLVEMYQLTERT